MTIHLHLGAHKTASTHLQAVMRKNASQLENAGVRYADPAELRSLLGPAQRAAEHLAPWPSLRAALAGRRLRRRIAQGSGMFIAADENTLGHCRDIMETGSLYPSARARLSLWRQSARGEAVTCFLAIRDYPEFFSGVHIQSMRDDVFGLLSANEANALAALPRRWTDLVADIRHVLPEARLVLWQFEDYPKLKGRLADRITGVKGLRAVERRSMQTPSQEAMLALRSLAASHPDGVARRDAFTKIVLAHPVGPGNPRYDPWSSEQKRVMRAAYAEDIDHLIQDPQIEFMRP